MARQLQVEGPSLVNRLGDGVDLLSLCATQSDCLDSTSALGAVGQARNGIVGTRQIALRRTINKQLRHDSLPLPR